MTFYAANKNDFPPLSQAQLNKLRHLTIISLATKNKVTSEIFPLNQKPQLF